VLTLEKGTYLSLTKSNSDTIKVSKNYIEILKEVNANLKNRLDLLKKHLSRADYDNGRPIQKKGDRRAISILWDAIKNYLFYWKKFASLVLINIKIKL